MSDEMTKQELETQSTESEQVKTETTQSTEEKTFTQSDVDKLISERIKRERKNYAQQIEDERKKAAMDESERLRLEKDQAELKAIEATKKANQRIINSEAKVVALSLGIKAERLPYLHKLLDLSNVEIDEDGNLDTKLIKSAIDNILKDFPELIGNNQSTSRAGNDFSSGGNAQNPENMSMDEYKKWRNS